MTMGTAKHCISHTYWTKNPVMVRVRCELLVLGQN